MTPEGWHPARLKDLTERITKGESIQWQGASYQDKGVPFFRTVNVQEHGLTLDGCKHISEDVHARMLRSQLKSGDILISIAGTLGRVGVVPACVPRANINQDLAVVRLRNGAVYPPFLVHWLRGPLVRSQIDLISQGGTRQHLNLEQTGNLQVLLPPVSEQRKIAAILSSINETIDLSESVLGQLRIVRNALLWNLFGGARPTDESRQITLGEAVTLHRGFDLPADGREAGPYPVMASNGPVGFHSKFQVKGPGVITGRSGTIGKVFFEERDFWPLNTTLFVTDFHGNDPKFAAYLLESLHLDRFVAATGVPSLNRNFIHPLTVRIPPLEEQNRIAARISSIDEALRSNSQFVNGLKRVKVGLLKALFLGNIRVTPDGAAA